MMHRLLLLLAITWSGSLSFVSAQIIETEAEYAVIMDYDTGEVLYSKNGDVPMTPASMTKMMTAQVVFSRLKSGEIALTDTFTVSQNAWEKGGWSSGGSTMGLGIGDEPTVEELLRGVVVLSGNDACIVLAEGLDGSEAAFAREMTDVAQDMGLTSASFENATGLYGEGHRISAADLARLARYQIRDYPEYYAFYTEESYEWRGISQPNRNPLLGREGVDGLKTGWLDASGYGLTASATRDGVRRIIVLNGMTSVAARASEAERLLRIAFSSFETKTVKVDGEPLAELPVWLGANRTVRVRLGEPLTISGHKRAFAKAVTEIVYDGPIMAPVRKGDEVARLVITLDGKEPVSAPLLAMDASVRLGFFGRAAEGLSVMMSGDDELDSDTAG